MHVRIGGRRHILDVVEVLHARVVHVADYVVPCVSLRAYGGRSRQCIGDIRQIGGQVYKAKVELHIHAIAEGEHSKPPRRVEFDTALAGERRI